MSDESVDLENLPPTLQKLYDGAKTVKSTLLSPDKSKMNEEEYIKILDDTINLVGKAMNEILEERKAKPSTVYTVIYEAMLKIKESINFIPADEKYQTISHNMFTLSMFLINNLMYFASDDVEKLNLIAIMLSEILLISTQIDGSKTLPDKSLFDNPEEFSKYWRFSGYLISMLTNAIEKVPTLSEGDFTLWGQTAMRYAMHWMNLLTHLTFEILVEKNTKDRKIDFKELYFDINIQTVELLAACLLSGIVLNIIYGNKELYSSFAEYFGKKPIDNQLNYLSKSITIITNWIDKAEELYEEEKYGSENDPAKFKQFTIAKLANHFLIFLHCYGENISLFFNSKSKINTMLTKKKSSSYLKYVVNQGEQLLSFFEEIFEGRENTVVSPYFGAYTTVLFPILALSFLYASETKNYNLMREQLEIIANIKEKITIQRAPQLYVNHFIGQFNIAYHEKNEKKILEIVEEVDKVLPDIQNSDYFATLTLKILSLLNKSLLKTIEHEELLFELETLANEIIEPYFPYLKKRFNEDKDALNKIYLREKIEYKGTKVKEINPFNHITLFYPKYWLMFKNDSASEGKIKKVLSRLKLIKESSTIPKYKFISYLNQTNKIHSKRSD